MTLHRRQRKARDALVWDLDLDIDLIRQTTESGAEDDRHFGLECSPAADDVGRGLNPVVQHCRCSHPSVRSPNSTVPSRIIVAPSSTATG